jgi:hypothetical protein
MEKVIQVSALDWTIARPARLTESDDVDYRSRRDSTPCCASRHPGVGRVQLQHASNQTALSGRPACAPWRIPAMNEAMSGCRRAYDHRLRELACEEGNAHLLGGIGVPRSTTASWLRRGPRAVVTLDVVTKDTIELQAEVMRASANWSKWPGCRSGPGGRRFESCLPDQFSPASSLRFFSAPPRVFFSDPGSGDTTGTSGGRRAIPARRSARSTRV